MPKTVFQKSLVLFCLLKFNTCVRSSFILGELTFHCRCLGWIWKYWRRKIIWRGVGVLRQRRTVGTGPDVSSAGRDDAERIGRVPCTLGGTGRAATCTDSAWLRRASLTAYGRRQGGGCHPHQTADFPACGGLLPSPPSLPMSAGFFTIKVTNSPSLGFTFTGMRRWYTNIYISIYIYWEKLYRWCSVQSCDWFYRPT